MSSDEQLVAAALRGDDAAFHALVARYQEKLLRFLRTRCATPADAEDVFQEAFLDAWRYLYSFNPRWRFSTWLYRIAIRRASRTERRETHRVDDVAGSDDPLVSCMADSERDNLWLVARRTLSKEACTALWLYYVDEMPQKEVARALERSLPWTKVTLLRARRRLRAALQAGDTDGKERKAYG